MSAAAVSNQASTLRYSTYSGAPSIHPSIAPTMESNRSQPTDSARNLMARPASQGNAENDKPHRADSTISSSTADVRSADIKEWGETIDRLADQRLEKQRFVPTSQKTDEIATNALGAKLERALGRRMSGQDAVFKSRAADEKAALEASS